MKRKLRRTLFAGIALLAVTSAVAYVSPVSIWANVDVQTQSSTQMSSDKEVVYVNAIKNDHKRSHNFDDNWKFYFGDAGSAQDPNYDDSRWRNISLPHDYSIEQAYSKTMEAESGYLPGGIGWYRKTFTVGNDLEGKQFRLDFDGVYMNATVYINGVELGTHPYGYTPFSFDITKHIRLGEENVLAVKVNHKTPSSRWYSGSGIYRSVNLEITDPVRVGLHGTKVETPSLATNQENVAVKVSTTVKNSSDTAQNVVVSHKVFEKNNPSVVVGEGSAQATTVPATGEQNVVAEFTVANPKLWSVESPSLYVARTEVRVGDTIVDAYDTDYGFRYTRFDKDTGFYLNGQALKLKGVCMHHDQGALGAVANRRAMERQVEILQQMGCNSIRVTHNPAAQELIDICNEKGILIVEEVFDGWHHAKNGNTEDFAKYFDRQVGASNHVLGATGSMTWAEFALKSTLLRDRNAPSVIMWSLGNEIQEGNYRTGFLAKAPNLIRWAQEVDQTKELTIGSNQVKNENPTGEHSQIADLITQAGGTSGTNYSNGASYDRLRQLHPTWKLYGSETASSVNSRGVYHTQGRDNTKQELSSFDTSKVNWGALASDAWFDVVSRDFVAGTYVWTGFDYIGEPTHWNGTNPGPQGTWPSPKNSFFGIVDTAGLPKDSYYLYQSQWNDKVNTLHILPTWNREQLMLDAQNKVDVVVYSDAPKVELWFTPQGSTEARKVGDARELVTKTTDAGHTYQVVKDTTNKLYRTWKVPFEAGTLEARAFDAQGSPITSTQGRSSVSTAGAKASLRVKADRETIKANGTDISYVQIDVVDVNGVVVPLADDYVTVEVTGGGKLVGMDNGWQTDHDSYKASKRRVYHGTGVALVQAGKNTGPITVKVSAEGLGEQTLTIQAQKETQDPQAPVLDSLLMSKNYYVKIGNQPTLPATIEARFTDGTKAQVPVTWSEVTNEQIQTADSFVVKGMIENNQEVSVRVNMIDAPGGLLNYSTAVPVGTTPTLPQTRPAYLSDGTILNVSFPVTWEAKDASAYNTPGIVTVNGSAQVLGKEIAVTASVRVAHATVSVGESVSGASSVLEQDIPENLQSDHLPAIKDGNTGKNANNQGGTNTSVWTNFKSSNTGNKNTASIIFGYDTQVVLGEIVIHFFEDTYSARFPNPQTTKIYTSETKEGPWTLVQAHETIGQVANHIKPYTYTFDAPLQATFFKFEITNKDEWLQNRKPCTGITEIELKKATTSFSANSTAELSALTVNDTELTAQQLRSGEFSTSALSANVEAQGKDNAAVTVLPKNANNEIHIIIESEDHTATNSFVVHLDSEDPDVFYPTEDIAATSPSVLANPTANEGSASYVLDDNVNTHWHTNWRTQEGGDVANRAVVLTLKEPASIDALSYYPRVFNGKNGRVTSYKVLYSQDGTTFNDTDVAAQGTISKDKADWSLLEFAQPVTAKAFKFVGVETFADTGNNKHMAVAELKLRMSKNTIDIASVEQNAQIEPIAKQVVDVVDVQNPVEPQVRVTLKGTPLRYGVDYKVRYADNTAVGTAKAIVQGIGKYAGIIEVPFVIETTAPTITSIAVKTAPKTDYFIGEQFVPEGLVLSVFMSDDTSKDVAYTEENKADFTFSPDLETALAEDTTKVTVTYEGKSADITLRVTQKPETPVVPDEGDVVVPVNPGDAGEVVDPEAPEQDPIKPANTSQETSEVASSETKVLKSKVADTSDPALAGVFGIAVLSAVALGGAYATRKKD